MKDEVFIDGVDFLTLEEKAAENGNDIHKQTAIELFGECTSEEQRRAAKMTNFGLIYGGKINVTGCITGRFSAKGPAPVKEIPRRLK